MESDLIGWPPALWQQHKATQGTERGALRVNVGVGLDVSVDVDVNEPLHDWEREEDRKRPKEGESRDV